MKIGTDKGEGRAVPVPAERRRLIAERIRAEGSITVATLEEDFAISAMTARRDLAVLEREGIAKRTYGGAILPGLASIEDSFQSRVERSPDVKDRLAKAAVQLVRPGETIFIDSSSSAFYVARRIMEECIQSTLITNSAPVMELFCRLLPPNIELVGIGGTLRKLTLSFVGPHAERAIGAHLVDRAFLSVKGIARDGSLTDPDVLEARVKQMMIDRSDQSVLLVDSGKLTSRGNSVIAGLSDVSLVLAADISYGDLQRITPGVETLIVP